MDTILQDVRYGVRRILRSPGFSLIVVLTLALGIGANTAIFSVVNAVLLRPLPYGDPGALVTIQHFYPSLPLDAPVSAPGFRDYRERTRAFSSMGVTSSWAANLTGIGEPERIQAGRVSAGYLETFGVPAARGRLFLPEEDEPGRNHEVVLSYGFWQRRLGGKPDVIGSTLSLNGETYDVVGVMPAEFQDFFSRNRELWTPLALEPEQFVDDARTNEWLNLAARLRPGVTIEQAANQMTKFAEVLKQEHPDNYPERWSLKVTGLSDLATRGVRPALLVLLGAVAFVLLIACANVANLLLARSAGRTKEIAIRSALGAKRWQLMRQLLAESVLLALAGGALGLALAYWGVRALVALNPANLPGGAIGIDGAVLGFTLLISIGTGVLFGLVPALQISRTDVQSTLREGGRGAHADRSGHVLRRILVVAEIALALTLLTGAGLLLRSFARLQQVDPGFRPDHLLTFSLSLPQAKYPSDTARIAFFDRLFPRLAAVPGVQAVGGTSVMPFGGSWSTGSFNIEGIHPASNESSPWGDIRYVSPGFARALGIPLVRGRFFSERDGPDAPMVAVVDEELVRRYWPNEDPIGRRITFDDPDEGGDVQWIQVIGVVGHAMHEGLDADPRVQLYLSYRQRGIPFLNLAVRTAGPPESLVGALREAVHSVDRDQPLAQISTMDDLIAQSVGQRKLAMVLLGVFAGMALLMATLGIYGLMSHMVAQRAHELGIRMALGAERGIVLGLVLRQGMALAAAGVAVGLLGAFGLTRLVRSQLFGVGATDPLTFTIVAATLLAVALLATWLPALRATRLDPVSALRLE